MPSDKERNEKRKSGFRKGNRSVLVERSVYRCGTIPLRMLFGFKEIIIKKYAARKKARCKNIRRKSRTGCAGRGSMGQKNAVAVHVSAPPRKNKNRKKKKIYNHYTTKTEFVKYGNQLF